MPEKRPLLPLPPVPQPEQETVGIPIPVVPDWDVQLQAATRMAQLIDRHLDYEAYSRSVVEAEQLTPRRLCPEQRVDLITDVYAVISR